MLKIGDLHTHIMSDAPAESPIVYWRVQVLSEKGAPETLIFTDSDIKKARERVTKHAADVLPPPAARSLWERIQDLWP